MSPASYRTAPPRVGCTARDNITQPPRSDQIDAGCTTRDVDDTRQPPGEVGWVFDGVVGDEPDGVLGDVPDGVVGAWTEVGVRAMARWSLSRPFWLRSWYVPRSPAF